MNVLGIGPGELVLILIIAVIVLGPDKIPETMRTVGKAMREIRTITEGFQKELNRELAEVTKEPPAQPATAQPATAVAAVPAQAASDEPVPVNAKLPPPYGPVETPAAETAFSAKAEPGAEKTSAGDGNGRSMGEARPAAAPSVAEEKPMEPAASVTADEAKQRE
jgi:sec-independent protein translocase protein TatB